MRRQAIGALALAAWAVPAWAVPDGNLGRNAHQCVTQRQRVELMEETGKLRTLLEEEIPRARREERASVRAEIMAACIAGGAEEDWCRRMTSGETMEQVEQECLEDGMDPESCTTIPPGEE